MIKRREAHQGKEEKEFGGYVFIKGRGMPSIAV